MPYWVRNMAGPFNAVFGRFTFTRYLLASICALSADFALFMLLHRLGASPALAALGGYSGGLVLHWMLSTQFVFEMRKPPTHGQRIAFILSALIGMAITMGLVGGLRSEEHTSELQSLMRISYAVFCLQKNKLPC